MFGCPKNCPDYCETSSIDTSIELSKEEQYYVDLCRNIRQFVALGQIEINTKEHSISDNLHLVKFLEICGKSFKEVILQYLTDIQPFQLKRDASQEYDNSVYCVIDLSYSFALYLKITFTSDKGIVISFHENQIMNQKKYKKETSDLNYMIAKTSLPAGTFASIPVKISHGLVTFEFVTTCFIIDTDLVRVNLEHVNSIYLEYANQKISDLVGEQREVFSSIKEVSFTSYGEAILNNISVLVDAICFTHLKQQEKLELIDTLRLQMIGLVQLPDSQKYIEALDERYSMKLGKASFQPRILLELETEVE